MDGLIASVVIMAIVSCPDSLACLALGPRDQALRHFGLVGLELCLFPWCLVSRS